MLVGFYQYFTGNWGIKQLDNFPNGMGDLMKNAVSRFWVIEHFVTMTLAIVFITIVYSNIKKSVIANVFPAKAKWFLLVAILLILAGMPWAFKEAGAGRPWFPGM